MQKFNLNIYFLFLLASLWVHAITAQTLEYKDLLRQVRAYHPLSRQADLQTDMADAYLLKAKGNFDPSVAGALQQKYFENKEYFSLLNTELKIPTPFGADLKAGYDFNKGVFLGPENTTPSNGLLYAGISLPIGQGLLIDERRAELRYGKIGQKSGAALKRELANDLLFQTTMAYWNWFRVYHVRQIFRDALVNARERFEAVKFSTIGGERPIIDTTEAKIQIQIISMNLNQAEMEFQNTSTMLSGFIWDENDNNTGIPAAAVPVDLDKELAQMSLYAPVPSKSDFAADHPYLEQIRQKLLLLDTEKRLKKDKLKPRVNLVYNPITEAVGSGLFTDYNINNYKWGMEFKMPLYLRKERGDLKITEIKIEETSLVYNNKATELYNKYITYVTEWEATNEQVKIFNEAVSLYEQMLNAERRLFAAGESSLFLVNAREQSYINAKSKLTELVSKNRISYYAILYYAGKMEALLENR